MSQSYTPQFIDTHCHLDFPQYNSDRNDVIARAHNAGVIRIINVGSSLAGSKASLALSSEYEQVYAAIGCHPHDAHQCDSVMVQEFRRLASASKKIVAIGEIGLDYFRTLTDPVIQRNVFEELLTLAEDVALPVVVHCRDAQDDVLNILDRHLRVRRVVIHCFSGGLDFLQKCLTRGYYISFTANITYPKAQNIRDAIKEIPLDKLMLETDSPYLPPQEFRGQRNEPAFVIKVAQEAARIKNVGLAQISGATTENAFRFFALP